MAYSYVQYNGNGSTTAFSIPFPYIDKAHVSVTLDGVLFAGFTFLSASSISVSPAPAAGVLVEVRRVTPKTSRMVDYQDAAVLTAAALDLNADQSMYIVQEAHDLAGDFNASGNIIRDEAVAAAEEAAASAASILGAVVDAGAEADAAAQSASEAATSAANAATSETNAATSANTATTKAGEAVTSASNAASSASGASTSATTASTQATNAATSATTATTQAGNAATSATTATTKADEASASATAASGSASTASSAATTATTKAAEASTSATNAATSASTAASAVSTHAAVTATHGATGAVVGTTNVQTLTNKTLTAPKLSTEVVDVVVNNRPSIRPSLNLDFANSEVLDPRVTFTRASTATYYDDKGVLRTAAANTARFDHDPVTGESKGLLIEEARTNLLTYSEQFDHADWTNTGLTTSIDSVTAPDGTVTADKLVEDSSTGTHQRYRSLVTTAQQYTFSVYAKAAERSVIALYNSVVASGKFFDLATGLVGNDVSNAPLASSIEDVGGGWYRCSITLLATAATNNFRVYLNSTSAYAGDGTSGIYIWGAQLEAGAFPTSYIKTEASTVTRSADVAVMTGTNFSDWYRADEGTVYSDVSPIKVDGDIAWGFGPYSNSIYSTAGVSGHGVVVTSEVVQAILDGGAYVDGVQSKNAFAYAVNDFAVSLNGGTVVTDLAGTLPTVSVFTIGGLDGNTANRLNGHIKRLAYYPKRLSNTELQAITQE
jgi:hypothetical protein